MPEHETTLEPDIVGTPEAVVDEAYRLISFEPGSQPQWDRFKALFSPRAVLAFRVFPEDDAVTIMDLEDYVVRQMREGMEEEGYSETILRRDWLVFGDVAEARVVFEMKFGEAEPVPALDIYQLVRREGRWWIVSIISEVPRPGTPLPEILGGL